MCGRYASFIPADRLHRLFRTGEPDAERPATWNMAPTRDAPVVRRTRRRTSATWTCCAGAWCRTGRAIPRRRASRSTPGPKRSPPRRCSATRSPAGAAWCRRRVLRMAGDRGPETPLGNRPGKTARRWYSLGCGRVGAVADGTVLRTFTIVTTQANDALRPLHERMPVVLEEGAWPLWLSETDGQATDLLRPSATEFRVRRVSTAVNNVRNDQAELLAR